MASKIWTNDMNGGDSIGGMEKTLGTPVSVCKAGTPTSHVQQRCPMAWESEVSHHHSKPPFPLLSNGHSCTLNETESQRGGKDEWMCKSEG